MVVLESNGSIIVIPFARRDVPRQPQIGKHDGCKAVLQFLAIQLPIGSRLPSSDSSSGKPTVNYNLVRRLRLDNQSNSAMSLGRTRLGFQNAPRCGMKQSRKGKDAGTATASKKRHAAKLKPPATRPSRSARA